MPFAMNSKLAMKSVLMMGAAAGMMMASGGAMAQSGGYTYTSVNVPGDYLAEPWAINASGQTVGTYFPNAFSNYNGFIETNGRYTALNDPLGVSGWGTNAQGINDGGTVVGYYYTASEAAVGFLYANGTFKTISVPGATYTEALGVNNAGQIVGWYETGGLQGFIDTNGTFTTISVPGTTYTSAAGINNVGQIVGTDSNGAFLDTNGTFVAVSDPLGTKLTVASGINDSGQIVGRYEDSSATWRGFVDSSGTFVTINVPGSTLTEAVGVNSAGDIVGIYEGAGCSDQCGFLATPDGVSTDSVPLPVAGGTLPGAMVLLGWLGRRLTRRRNA